MRPRSGGRRPFGTDEVETGPVIALLLFEAADGLMALPVSEVTRLLVQPGSAGPADEAPYAAARVDLDEYFTGRSSTGPWLRWGRSDLSVWLRVARVVEVLSYAVRALAPMPVRATGHAGVFWAAGARGDDVFLLVDPARLADRRDR